MFDTKKCPFLPQETPFTVFLSRMWRESQHTRFEDQILGPRQLVRTPRNLCQPGVHPWVESAWEDVGPTNHAIAINVITVIIALVTIAIIFIIVMTILVSGDHYHNYNIVPHSGNNSHKIP